MVVAAFAMEVTLARDAEDENWRDMEALLLPVCANLCRAPLPGKGFDEKDRLRGTVDGGF